MKLLLDECIPDDLAGYFVGHDVRTLSQMSWRGKRNGELMALAVAEAFDVFVTADQSIPHQHNLSKLRIAIVLIRCLNTNVETVAPLVPLILRRLDFARPGRLTVVP